MDEEDDDEDEDEEGSDEGGEADVPVRLDHQ